MSAMPAKGQGTLRLIRLIPINLYPASLPPMIPQVCPQSSQAHAHPVPPATCGFLWELVRTGQADWENIRLSEGPTD